MSSILERLKAQQAAREASRHAETPTEPSAEISLKGAAEKADAEAARAHAPEAKPEPAPAPEPEPEIEHDSPSAAVESEPEPETPLKSPVRRLAGPTRRIASPAAPSSPNAGRSASAPADTGRPGLRPVGRRVVQTPEPIADEAPLMTDENAAPPADEAPAPSSLIASIKSRATKRINGAPVIVNQAALDAVERGDVFSAQEMLQELQNAELLEGEETDDELNAVRADILTKGANRIEQIFAEELEGLAITEASDFAITEMSQIVKLTFMRVKNSPIAWDLMENANKASLIKAMRAMAAKRNNAVQTRAKGKKSAAELSQSLDTLSSTLGEDVADEAMAMLGDMDFNI